MPISSNELGTRICAKLGIDAMMVRSMYLALEPGRPAVLTVHMTVPESVADVEGYEQVEVKRLEPDE